MKGLGAENNYHLPVFSSTAHHICASRFLKYIDMLIVPEVLAGLYRRQI